MNCALLCLLVFTAFFTAAEGGFGRGLPSPDGGTRFACPAQCRAGQRRGDECTPGCHCQPARNAPVYERLYCVERNARGPPPSRRLRRRRNSQGEAHNGFHH
ncbi:hypothetical protein V5799_033792 [Amblyomma americanum]|uniref:Secreted protein n=1 Tax=Amblyomma americanum TaxID=6943 RepID=A0AAQ4DMA6_AMBAM